MEKRKTKQIEKIFGAHLEENPNEIIRKIESYGTRYDPDSDLSAFNQLQICEAVAESTPVKEKKSPLLSSPIPKENKEVLSNNNSFVYMFVCIADKFKRFKNEPEKIGRIVAKALDDLNNLPQYKIQAYERKRIYIQRCLKITLKALKEGKIKKEKVAGYYWGVCKTRDRQLEVLKKYRKRKRPVI